MNTLTQQSTEVEKDLLPLNGTDHIEFYVGNAKQAAIYYQAAFGFELVAYKGPETGVRDIVSYVLQQGKIRFVLTSALHADHEIAKHVALHGDGVKVLALWVDDAVASYELTVGRGAESVFEPVTLEDEFGKVIIASIKTYGETIHTFVQRSEYSGAFMPGFIAKNSLRKVESLGLLFVDHCVGNVELGQMNNWVKYYEDVMGFKLLITFDDNDISTEYTALMSKVVSNGNGYVKFPINEPAMGKKKSQIEEYLDFYKTSGVQHIAVATNDIISTVDGLRNNGVEFLEVPNTYYEDLFERLGEIDEPIFTKPVQDRPTVFFEIIQRKGATSFGKGNFKALFEAIEREQELRGTL